ncbi:MAG: DUF2934 domain-containing protein [Acidobacteriaceae bacterium]|nr:DUF2934 domain-containing protein [Acidobacteriaceae bacterium]
MQSNKASKKTQKIAEDTAVTAPETQKLAAGAGNPRTTTSSKPKKNETNEMIASKHHRKGTSPATSEKPAIDSIVPKTVAAGAGAGSPSTQDVRSGKPNQEDIAKLAHSYWVVRGHAHGSAEEDWLRAERELTQKP